MYSLFYRHSVYVAGEMYSAPSIVLQVGACIYPSAHVWACVVCMHERRRWCGACMRAAGAMYLAPLIAPRTHAAA